MVELTKSVSVELDTASSTHGVREPRGNERDRKALERESERSRLISSLLAERDTRKGLSAGEVMGWAYRLQSKLWRFVKGFGLQLFPHGPATATLSMGQKDTSPLQLTLPNHIQSIYNVKYDD